MIKNMTTGSPAKLILTFALPLLIGNIFQQLYSVTDILIVGRLIGVNALAAVGATAPIYFLFLLIAFGFTGGLTVITAQRFGSDDIEGVRKSITHCFMASTTLSLLISISLICFLKPLLRIMNVPQEIMTDAYNFMIILSGGLVMTVFYNLLAGFLRALGDSRTPLYFLIFSTILNILFNFILIYYFKFGIKGSAVGTVSAITIAVILCLIYIRKNFPIMHISRSHWKFDAKFMRQHLNVALPMAVQFSILALSMMIIQSVCNSFGPDVIAAFTAALRTEQVATQPLVALGLAMATFSAQNWGAGKIKRIRQGVRRAALFSLLISIAASLIVRFIGSDLISVFIKGENPYIVEIGRTYLRISTFFYFFLGMIFIFRNTLQGMGSALIPLFAGITELAMRSFAAVYLAHVIGYKGIFYAGPIAWLGASIVVMTGYVYTIRHIKSNRIKGYYKQNDLKIRLSASINHVNQTAGE